jgi:3-deoxy-7-phosphoheptulonate synthase / chorismate mutase
MNSNLKQNRKNIDELDRLILNLIGERLSAAQELIESKIDNGIDIFDPARENEIIQSLTREFEGKIDSKLIESVFMQILNVSKNQFSVDETSIIDSKQPILIAGPCSIESQEQITRIAKFLSGIGVQYLRGGAHKPRTSPSSFQGLGDIGFEYIKNAANEFSLQTISEVLSEEQLQSNYSNIDIVQIGSRSMASYGLLKAVGKITAKDKKPVILKRGQTSTITEFIHAADYIINAGNPNVILCLRGIRTFEQIDSSLRNTADLSSILELKSKSDLKIIFDPSHASGDSDMVLPLSKAAMDLGADGIMVESHYDPSCSISDAKQTISLEQTEELAGIMKEYRWKR